MLLIYFATQIKYSVVVTLGPGLIRIQVRAHPSGVLCPFYSTGHWDIGRNPMESTRVGMRADEEPGPVT